MIDLVKDVVETKQMRPPRIVIYGPPKVGKSTFAASAPGVLMIDIEDGLEAIDAKAVKAPEYEQVFDTVKALHEQSHDFKAVAIDSGDWLEHAIQRSVAKAAGKTNIADIPYGAGYTEAGNIFKNILEWLTALRDAKNMASIIICHDQIKRFDDPMQESYDRHQLKLHDKTASVLREWADAILFCTQEVFTVSKEKRFNKEIVKGKGGDNIMYAVGSPAYVAGNRYGLPERMDLSWEAFMQEWNRTQQLKG